MTSLYSPTVSAVQLWRTFIPVYTNNVPKRFQRLLLQAIPSTAMKKLINIADTMYSKAKIVWEKKKALHALGDDTIVNQLGEGKDLMSILRAL